MTTAMFQILVVEDDAELRAVLRTMLEVQPVPGQSMLRQAERGLIEARSHRPDLVIADLGLPDMDGAALIRDVRSFSQVPILVLSARTMETEKIGALDAGADDYVTKPFSAPELLARVRAALRRTGARQCDPACAPDRTVTVDLAARTALGPDGAIHLTPLEFRVLECLARRPGMIVTQKQLIREAWGPDRLGDTRGLRSYIKTLRQKLEPDPGRPRFVVTEAGIGYRLLLDDRHCGLRRANSADQPLLSGSRFLEQPLPEPPHLRSQQRVGAHAQHGRHARSSVRTSMGTARTVRPHRGVPWQARFRTWRSLPHRPPCRWPARCA